MDRPEFVALQATVLVRSGPTSSKEVELFLDSIEFKAAMQEKLANLMQENLREHEIAFDEIIISLDRPAEKVQSSGSTANKPSMLGRLLGRR